MSDPTGLRVVLAETAVKAAKLLEAQFKELTGNTEALARVKVEFYPGNHVLKVLSNGQDKAHVAFNGQVVELEEGKEESLDDDSVSNDNGDP